MNQVYGVIGDPVGHSLSPLMHETAFRALDIQASYHAFHVTENRLKEAVDGVRGLGIKGINVTIPHKVAILPFLDEIDPLAARIGAVNTVVNENGRLKGYNTDGEGYMHGLLPVLPGDLNEMRALVIGAGGAAKGVALTLTKYGLKNVWIANRTLSKAEALAEECGEHARAEAIPLELAQARLTEFDLIINTTSIGMTPEIDRMPLSLETVAKGAVVSDLIYTPKKTRFLQEAESRGALTQNGLKMFVNQGALAFEKWTGIKPPVQLMMNKVMEKLEE